jgi:hypothetical protein
MLPPEPIIMGYQSQAGVFYSEVYRGHFILWEMVQIQTTTVGWLFWFWTGYQAGY